MADDHGRADSLILVNHSSRPWVATALANGHDSVRYYEIENAQHVDAVLENISARQQLVWMQPYYWDALDRVLDHMRNGSSIPSSQVVRTRPGIEPGTGRLLEEPLPGDRIELVDGVFTVPE